MNAVLIIVNLYAASAISVPVSNLDECLRLQQQIEANDSSVVPPPRKTGKWTTYCQAS